MASLRGRRVSTPSKLPQLLEPHDSQTKDYQDADETHDSKLKDVWDTEMEGLHQDYTPYTKVSVLLLSWDKEIDDLKTDKEVTDLENLFKDKFMFDTTREVLKKGEKSPQSQVNHYLAQFVYENDDTNTMLIIYYAGHGRPGNGRGNLRLTPSISLPRKSNGEFHEIVWESAESNIRETKADVLVIFDCCHAGELERSVRGHWQHRAFEYLAATSAKSTTRKPGPRSFTRALIWSLDHLVKTRAYFSTTELLRTIHNDAPHFPRKQCPRLSEGQLPAQRKIMIAPLTTEAKKRAAAEASSRSQKANDDADNDTAGEDRRHDFLLRFVFDCDITEEMLKTIASHMKDLIKGGEINAKVVAWEGSNGVNYRDAVIAQPWLRHFANSLSRMRRGGGERSSARETASLLGAGSDAASSPRSEMYAVTPEPARRSAEVEIGEDQGATAEKPPSLLDTGRVVLETPHRRKSKRKRHSNDDGANESSIGHKRTRAGNTG
ncbi:hypothetical protein PG993_012881 [Apiospora rasikravindrae]|uniref:Peptidase C14 caspase domain-containing protein n=1 Tax=Apiospora rasikravindrae TaxID=990691 RepID=A0ABR1RY43_9PEZI